MNIKESLMNCLEVNGITVLTDGTFEDMDSYKFISMIVGIESEFSIEFPDEYLLMNIMSDFECVHEILQQILNNKIE